MDEQRVVDEVAVVVQPRERRRDVLGAADVLVTVVGPRRSRRVTDGGLAVAELGRLTNIPTPTIDTVLSLVTGRAWSQSKQAPKNSW